MHKEHPHGIWTLIATLLLLTLACSLFTSPAPTPALFQLPTGLPAQGGLQPPVGAPTQGAAVPASTEAQTAPTAGVAASTDQVMADVRDYYGRGYLPYQNGQLTLLDDFVKTQMSSNVFTLGPTKQQPQDFALWADIELDSRGFTTYPNYTGCGFAYRVQSNSDGYTAILTNDAVRMGACNSGFLQCTLFGTTYGMGTGMVNVPNRSKAQFSIAINQDHAWALVNGTTVGQYSLYTTKLLGGGDLKYAVVSNINAGYSSTCKITNVRLWESTP